MFQTVTGNTVLTLWEELYHKNQRKDSNLQINQHRDRYRFTGDKILMAKFAEHVGQYSRLVVARFTKIPMSALFVYINLHLFHKRR